MSIGNCPRCGGKNDDENEYCNRCRLEDQDDRFLGKPLFFYDEPMFYECSMCGMETIDYEIVRGHKYCRTCASIERHG